MQNDIWMLTCRYVIAFLKEHGKEVYTEARAAYLDTMNKVNIDKNSS